MGILSSETIAYKYFVWSYNSMWTSLMSGLATLHYSLLLLQRNQSDLAQFNFSQLITLPLLIIYPESLLTVRCYGSQHLTLFVQKQIWFNVSWPPEQASGSAGIMRVYQGAGLIWIEMLVPIVPVCFFGNLLFWKWESTEQVI